MKLEIINLSILESADQYIVHQLNSVTNHAAGLAKAIFDRFPYADVYSQRKFPHKPLDFELPGNIIIKGNGKDQRYVIGICGQYYPGKPKYPDSHRDGYEAREKAFKSGLDKIIQIPNLTSVSFPMGIGCTLAGGDWKHYLSMIEDFADEIPLVQLYKYK